MKKLNIILFAIILIAIACKKKKDQWCQYQAMNGPNPIYAWDVNRPSNDQIKKVEDTCKCTVSIMEICQPCTGQVTDAAGNPIACF
jgi:hypothetical protein